MINDLLSPNTGIPPSLDTANAPYGLDGTQGIELFSRKGVARYDGLGNYIEEDLGNPYTLYSAGNLVINQDILSDYDKICLSKTKGDVSDNSVTHEMLNKWSEASLLIEPGLTNKLNFNEYYTEFISNIGNKGISVNAMKDHQELMVMQIENQRSSKTAVSSDEELSNMIKFQHAYNAAAKVVTVLDQMIEQIVTSTGLVGR
jgi:flagellar hook-associated protein 1 FlgK